VELKLSGESVMLPSECSLPDLTRLLGSGLDQSFFVNQLTGSESGFPENMLIYRRNFVRLTDKALRDYVDARNAVLMLIEKQKTHTLDIPSGRLLSNLIANKLEDCLVTLGRLFKYFERIRTDTTSFPVDRLFRKRIDAMEESIRDMRDLVVHMEADINEAAVKIGDFVAPALNEKADTISLGKRALRADVLARAITLFHEFALEFAQQEFRPDSTYGAVPKSGPVKR
jgi:hypothetical protein